MANSGFVSIGHLLFGESSDHDRISILREVCKKFSANFTLALNGADCIYRFDLFFGSVKPTVESFHKFLTSFLKKPNEDEIILELKIEKFIWDQYGKSRFPDTHSTEFSHFQLFAVFNRFCDTDSMALHDHWSRLLLKKICGVLPETSKKLDFPQFVQTIMSSTSTNQLDIKKSFDEFVLQIHISESQMRVRIRNDVSSFQHKTVIVTSKFIFITDLTENEDIFQQLYQFNEVRNPSTSQQQLFVTMVLASPSSNLVVQKPQKLLFSKKKTTNIIIKAANEDTLEINFDTDKDQFKIYQWTRALEKSLEHCRNRQNRLQEFLSDNFPNRRGLERLQSCLPIKHH